MFELASFEHIPIIQSKTIDNCINDGLEEIQSWDVNFKIAMNGACKLQVKYNITIFFSQTGFNSSSKIVIDAWKNLTMF